MPRSIVRRCLQKGKRINIFTMSVMLIVTTKIGYLYGELLGGYVELKICKLSSDILHGYLIRKEHGLLECWHHEIVSLIFVEAVAQLLYKRILCQT